MCWSQKAPHKVDNIFSGGKRAQVWSRRAALTQASSQVRWVGDLVRGSNYVNALVLIEHLRNWCCIDVDASLTLNNEHLLPSPRLDTSIVSCLHYIFQGILLVGGGDSPSTAELVGYNRATMMEYCKIHLWSKDLERSTYYTLKALFIKRDQCQPWWYIVNLVAKIDCGQWPSQFPLCLLCFHL